MADSENGINGQTKGDHTSIEISEESILWAASIKGKLDRVSPSPIGDDCCIYKVHEKFHKMNDYAYTPEMISIGPFHRDKITLQAMENQKLQYMKSLLSRNPDGKLQECVESIRQLEEIVRRSYSEHIDLDKEKLIEMMIVDGLFIIELFLKSTKEVPTEKNDPIFSNKWTMPSLVRDLILLENQMPMLVLNKLFQITWENQGGKSLNELAIRFFDPLMHRKADVLQNCFKKHGKHFLDLLRNTFDDSSRGSTSNNNLKLKHVPCVTKLRKAGVKFKSSVHQGNILDVKFIDGVLHIPPILIQDQTETLLRNLIASEQCCNESVTYMTSYAFLMDSLIDSSNDVGFLRKDGIIINCLGDDECVSSLFNKLCSEVTVNKFYYSELCNELNTFYKKQWNEWFADLRREYLQNPWKVMSVFAAILLLIFTFMATVFSVLSFAIHKS